MRITFFGTGSGTEPVPGYHHMSFAVEHGDRLYWFEAGESCSCSGHLAGLDLLRIHGIFISHCHLDHVGGLANLIWSMQKILTRYGDPDSRLTGRTIPLYIPNLETWKGIETLLLEARPSIFERFRMQVQKPEDGVLLEAHGFRVEAHHNWHIRPSAEGEWKSFSYRFGTSESKVVYSGDLVQVEEIFDLLPGSDLLLMETGHHNVAELSRKLAALPDFAGRVLFVHHNRAVIADREAQQQVARDILGEGAAIAFDGMTLSL